MDEATLDPEDWESFRGLMHRAADEAVDFLKEIRTQRVWTPTPPLEREPPPLEGVPEAEIFDHLVRRMLPYRLGNVHPRFWTRVGGTGTPMGVMADMLASAANSNAAGQSSSGTQMESQVIDWFKEWMGFPASASGLLTTGASTANLIGIAAARYRAFPEASGLGMAGQPQATLYCSEEAHISIDRAASILGIGLENVRRISADADFRIRIDELQSQIRRDRDAGLVPFCVVGSAGTVATGSTDDLEALADLASREGLWFHVDGAFGALLRLSERLGPIVKGIERADSLAFDLHKWLHIPYDAGCALVRDAAVHRAAFTFDASYLAVTHAGPAAGTARFYELGIDLSRGARGIKTWASLKHFGSRRYARSIEQNVDQARALADRIEREPRLSLMAPTPLNIVCVRFSEALSEAEHRRVNEETTVAIQESGLAIAGTIDVKGRNAMRVCITNHRTRGEDLDLFVDAVLAEGAKRLGS